MSRRQSSMVLQGACISLRQLMNKPRVRTCFYTTRHNNCATMFANVKLQFQCPSSAYKGVLYPGSSPSSSPSPWTSIPSLSNSSFHFHLYHDHDSSLTRTILALIHCIYASFLLQSHHIPHTCTRVHLSAITRELDQQPPALRT